MSATVGNFISVATGGMWTDVAAAPPLVGLGGSASRFPDACTILRREAGTDASGHPSGEFVELVQTRCRIGNLIEERGLAGFEGGAPVYRARVFLPAGTELRVDDRFLIDGKQWDVTGVISQYSHNLMVRCDVRGVD